MIEITVHETELRDLLKEFSSKQWPLADKEHYGNTMPDFANNKFTILAKESDQIIGFIYLETDMGVAIINDLLVHNEFQRKGVASRLMKAAEEKAKAEHCHVLKLETGKNWSAKQFYELQGFITIADLKEHYGKRDFVLMEKRLESSSE